MQCRERWIVFVVKKITCVRKPIEATLNVVDQRGGIPFGLDNQENYKENHQQDLDVS